MGGINPNPPTEESKVEAGLQFLYNWNVRAYNTAAAAVVPASAAATSLTTAGAQVFSPAASTLNRVTRLPRGVQQTGAGVNVNCGWASVYNVPSVGGSVFPADNGDAAGFRLRLYAGTDSVVGSVATTIMLSAAYAGSLLVPVTGTLITNNALAWIGLYNLGVGGGVRFGYKLVGSGVITNLDRGGSEFSTLWSPYQAWLLDIQCSPNGPQTFYSVSTLNAAGTAYVPLLVGSSTVFNPGRIPFGFVHAAQTTVAANNTDLFLSNASLLTYPYGPLSL